MKRELKEGEKSLFVYYGPKREVTVCLITDNKKDVIARGVAVCSDLDQPSKKRGRAIALGRALDATARAERGNHVRYRKGFMSRLDALFQLEDAVDYYPLEGVWAWKAAYRPDKLPPKEEYVVKRLRLREAV